MLKRNIFILFMFLCTIINAQNPILKGLGVSDPHVRVFNDTIYLYSGHDSSPTDKTWIMKDWRVFSSTDLIDSTPSIKDNSAPLTESLNLTWV